uniref:Uncharacterized protein n=1 Tax=Opuntia streptacantha TaxID=393608 RepID=A0A7C9EAM4_OPUST
MRHPFTHFQNPNSKFETHKEFVIPKLLARIDQSKNPHFKTPSFIPNDKKLTKSKQAEDDPWQNPQIHRCQESAKKPNSSNATTQKTQLPKTTKIEEIKGFFLFCVDT